MKDLPELLTALREAKAKKGIEIYLQGEYERLILENADLLLDLAEAWKASDEANQRMRKQQTCIFCNVQNQGSHSTLCPIEKMHQANQALLSKHSLL